jgi:hypothetical protein
MLVAATTLAAAPVDPRVAERAAGSDRPRAEAIVAAILPQRFAAQVLKVRVDGFDRHRVAGITVSGNKFHESLNEARFVAEIAQLVAIAFRDPSIEETDVWATVPLDAGHGAIVSGDLARPTSRNVFTLTVPRARAADVAALATSRDAFWDPTFRASLHAAP